jgi:RNA polymerase sigma-70 factor (ECF subfamily)
VIDPSQHRPDEQFSYAGDSAESRDSAGSDVFARVRAVLAAVHREEWAAVLSSTVRVAGGLDLAEECTQDAFVAALQTWPRDGIPDKPAAWLTTAARRRALDAHRRDQTLRRKLPMLIEPNETGSEPDGESGPPVIVDDRLRLIFTCCHPALAREAQVALTLRLVCGLTTAEIASAFLVTEATMAARVTRAKKKIAAARIPYRVPESHELPDRLDAVLTVLHLLFTAGHAAPVGDALVRPDLVERAVQLGRLLTQLMPDEGEVRGLLALMVVTDARRLGRSDADGALVLLEDQDRTLWDQAAIAEGHELLVGALRGGGRPGRFILQAAISSLHAEAPSYRETDWAQIVGLYDLLLEAWPSPVVGLNRAVAVAMAEGPQAGLDAIGRLDQGTLGRYHYLPAARADLLRRLGRNADAVQAYREALDGCENAAERAFLESRIAQLTSV